MKQFNVLKKKVRQRVAILQETIAELDAAGLLESDQVNRWYEQLGQVQTSLQNTALRIAVVGTVKSGKSTLINALLGTDLLRRGAGVITAFITRIMTNRKAGGWVELKTWAQIQDELNATVRLFPEAQEVLSDDHLIDLRDEADRGRLEELISLIQNRWLQQKRLVDANLLLLKGYLKGYPQICSFVGDTVNRLIFDPSSLRQHQHFVGDECQAVYLRDIELHYPIEWLGEGVEIADCQGIDSPNPMHFALLQEYLLKSHFILYVISSRTGLREADYRLLEFINTLEMLPQTFFIVNADLDDHPHAEDLYHVTGRLLNELTWIAKEPNCFVFSALYHLLSALGESASQRERSHLQLYLREENLVNASELGFAEFRRRLTSEVCGQRSLVLGGSGLSRLSMIAASVVNTAAAQARMLDHSIEEIGRTAARVKEREWCLAGSLETLRNAISGLRMRIKEEIHRPVEEFFDVHRSTVICEAVQMVENYTLTPNSQQNLTDLKSVFNQLHRLYLEFRQTLARYLVDRVNLQLIDFARKMETRLRQRIAESSAAFWLLFATAMEEYRREIKIIEGYGSVFFQQNNALPALRFGVTIPTFTAFVDQAAVGRGILLMKFGLAKLTGLLADFKAHLGKSRIPLSQSDREKRTVGEAVKVLKAEAKAELLQAFADYKQQLLFGCLHKIIDQETNRLIEEFQTRADMVILDLGNLIQHSQKKEEERLLLKERLVKAAQISQAMIEDLEGLRRELLAPIPSYSPVANGEAPAPELSRAHP